MRPYILAALTAAFALPAAVAAQDSAIVKATLDLGFVQTSGNTQVTTTNIGQKLTRERGRILLSQSFAYVYGEQRDTVNANNLRATVRGDYKLDTRFALFIGAGFDRNSFAGIRRRFEESIGLAMIALAAGRDTIRVEGGGSMIQQIPIAGLQTNFPAARAAGAWRHVFTPATYFQQNLEYIPNLKEHEDYRVNSESSVVAPLSSRIGLKVAYVIRFDNLPEPGFQELDKIFTTGIQVTF